MCAICLEDGKSEQYAIIAYFSAVKRMTTLEDCVTVAVSTANNQPLEDRQRHNDVVAVIGDGARRGKAVQLVAGDFRTQGRVVAERANMILRQASVVAPVQRVWIGITGANQKAGPA